MVIPPIGMLQRLWGNEDVVEESQRDPDSRRRARLDPSGQHLLDEGSEHDHPEHHLDVICAVAGEEVRVPDFHDVPDREDEADVVDYGVGKLGVEHVKDGLGQRERPGRGREAAKEGEPTQHEHGQDRRCLSQRLKGLSSDAAPGRRDREEGEVIA